MRTLPRYLQLLDELAAEGRSSFTLSDACERLEVSAPAAANMLARLRSHGLVDRVAHGHYAIRPLGMLGTSAASEDAGLAVGALFGPRPHRIAYRTALDLQGRLTHPSRVIQVASPHRVRIQTLSGRPFRVVLEDARKIAVGAQRQGAALVSDVERALLDAASRPGLIGGTTELAEAMAAGPADPERIIGYAKQLGAAAAVRRLGTLSDALHLPGLAGQLTPLKTPTSDLDLEPGAVSHNGGWRDRDWRVRWPVPREYVLEAVRH